MANKARNSGIQKPTSFQSVFDNRFEADFFSFLKYIIKFIGLGFFAATGIISRICFLACWLGRYNKETRKLNQG
jgi:hypothetical protein